MTRSRSKRCSCSVPRMGEGVSNGEALRSSTHRSRLRAAATVVRTDGASGCDELGALVRSLTQPYLLRETAMLLRTLAAAHPSREAASAALARLADVATLRARERGEFPPLESNEAQSPSVPTTDDTAGPALLLLKIATGRGDAARGALSSSSSSSDGVQGVPGSMVRGLRMTATG